MDEPETTQIALKEYEAATNMTEQIAALAALAQNPGDLRNEVLSKFYEQWKKEPLVRDNKWVYIPCIYLYLYI